MLSVLSAAAAPAEEHPSQGRVRVLGVERQPVADDLAHTAITLALDSGPNGAIRLHRVVKERAPWLPQPTRGAVLLLHGDFSSFASNFAPRLGVGGTQDGLGVWLAQQGFDVWGADRRWVLTPADGDLSDYGNVSFAQEVDDVGLALSVIRRLRIASGSGGDRLHLMGFSRGGFLAYAAAAADAALPVWKQQVRSLVPLDIWAEVAPDDEVGRAAVCASAVAERDYLAQGGLDSDNSFFINAGQLALAAPDEPSPYDETASNRALFLLTAGQTYQFFAPTERYHLAAGVVNAETGRVEALRESSEAVVATWFAQAAPHQSMREQADSDAIWCGDGSGTPAPDLSRIRVPLLYVGAAGGYGERGVYSTTRVASTDVTRLVIQRLPARDAAEDFGHADLLFAKDAESLVWQPLATWLGQH